MNRHASTATFSQKHFTLNPLPSGPTASHFSDDTPTGAMRKLLGNVAPLKVTESKQDHASFDHSASHTVPVANSTARLANPSVPSELSTVDLYSPQLHELRGLLVDLIERNTSIKNDIASFALYEQSRAFIEEAESRAEERERRLEALLEKVRDTSYSRTKR